MNLKKKEKMELPIIAEREWSSTSIELENNI